MNEDESDIERFIIRDHGQRLMNSNYLRRRLRRLQVRTRQLEKQIDESLDYFQDNYRSLAIKSLLPSFLAKAGITGYDPGDFYGKSNSCVIP